MVWDFTNVPWLKKVYETNYYAANESKLRSFQIRWNSRSIATNKQLCGFDIIDSGLIAASII